MMMETRILTKEKLAAFRGHLLREEKSGATVAKYMGEVKRLADYAAGAEITKDLILAYKRKLAADYAARSVNAKLAAVGSLLSFLRWDDCKVKVLKIQRQVYQTEEKELTKAEYLRLIQTAKGKPRLRLIIETICATGIRVSELQFFTVEAVAGGTVTVSCKNKTRNIFVPGKLRKLLLRYAQDHQIASGVIFCTRTGKPLDRSNIWAEMKKLCAGAEVAATKVFPHNLRKLFARTFYGIEKDIAKLADILGHSSIDTTRIYIMTTGAEHRRKMERLGLVV